MRHILAGLTHGSNRATLSPPIEFAGYPFTLLTSAPSRAYTSLWSCTLPAGTPTTGTLKYLDVAARGFYFAVASGPFAVADSISALSATGLTVSATLAAVSPGLVVALARHQAGPDRIVSVSGAETQLFGNNMTMSGVSSGSVTVTATIDAAGYSAISLVNITEGA